MSDDEMLPSLLELRRRSEQRALETLIAREGEWRRAQHQADEAAHATARHRAAAHALERNEVAAMRGRPASPAAMLRLRARLDAMSAEEQRLKDAEHAAQETAHERAAALAAARADHAERQRAAAKVDEMVKDQARKTARRDAAVAEAMDEEQANGGAARPQAGRTHS